MTRQLDTVSPQQPSPPELAAWKTWKASPTPENMGAVLREVGGAIDSAVSANPSLSPSLVKATGKTYAIRAIQSFDPSAGASLKTHVTNYLKPLSKRGHTMLSAAPQKRHTDETRNEYRKSFQDFTEEMGYEPSADEMARRLRISRDLSAKMMADIGGYEMPEGGIEGTVAAGGEDESVNDWVEFIRSELNDRDKTIIDYRLGLNGRPPLGLEEIAARVNLSPAGVHKVVSMFGSKLRESLSDGL